MSHADCGYLNVDSNNVPASPDARSTSLLELQVYLKQRTGRGQAFHRTYRDRLRAWLREADVSVLIGALVGCPDFELCEYAFAAWQNMVDSEDRLALESRYRERYYDVHRKAKYAEDMKAMAATMGFTPEPKSEKWTPEAELQSIIERTGKPNGPEARAHRKKWGMARA